MRLHSLSQWEERVVTNEPLQLVKCVDEGFGSRKKNNKKHTLIHLRQINNKTPKFNTASKRHLHLAPSRARHKFFLYNVIRSGGHSGGRMYFERLEKNLIWHAAVSGSSSRARDERCHYTSMVNPIGHSSYVAKRPQRAPLVCRGPKWDQWTLWTRTSPTGWHTTVEETWYSSTCVIYICGISFGIKTNSKTN